MLFSRYFIPEIFPNHHSIPYASPGDLFRKNDDQAISLPRVLEARGMATAAISAHEWITEQTPFAREFAFLFDLQSAARFDPKYGYPRADKVVDKAIEWIEKNRRRDYFLYLHVMDTHFPHLFEEDAASFYGPGRYEGNAFHETGVVLDPNREHDAADKKYLNALYDGGLRFADREIGRLASALKKWGRLDETLIVVTADHGEYLLDRRGYANHGGRWYEPLARIPLIVHYPAKVGAEKRGGPAGTVDIVPTVLALLGIPVPNGKSFDGADLFGTEGRKTRPVFADGGVRDGQYKLVFKSSATAVLGKETTTDAKKAGVELYDVAADPKETRDLAAERPREAERLLAVFREKLKPLYERHAAARTREQPRFSFAVSAPAFGKDAAVPMVPVEENPESLARIETPSGWLGRASWDNSWLFAKAGAKPLRISVPMPKGKYFVVADVWGAAEMEIEGRMDGPKVVIDAAGTGAGTGVPGGILRRGPKPVDIGEVDVEGERFTAVIRPGGNQGWFAVRYFGFDPIINGKRAGSVDPERERRLRSLGYIK